MKYKLHNISTIKQDNNHYIVLYIEINGDIYEIERDLNKESKNYTLSNSCSRYFIALDKISKMHELNFMEFLKFCNDICEDHLMAINLVNGEVA